MSYIIFIFENNSYYSGDLLFDVYFEPTHPPPLFKKNCRLTSWSRVFCVNDSSTFTYWLNILTDDIIRLFICRKKFSSIHDIIIVVYYWYRVIPRSCGVLIFALLRFFSIIVADESSIQRRQRTKPSGNLRVHLSFSLRFTVCCWLSNRTNEWMDQKHHNSKLFRHRIFYRYIDTMCHVVQW